MDAHWRGEERVGGFKSSHSTNESHLSEKFHSVYNIYNTDSHRLLLGAKYGLII